MRFIPVLLITVALATSAGCFGKDDENGGTPPTDTTPTGTTPTPTATPTATPTSPTADNNNTTPSTPAPRELCAPTFDFAGNTQAGTPPTHTTTAACGAVTAGYTKIALNGNFTAASSAPVTLADSVVVNVVDSTGTVVASCSGPSPGASATTVCAAEGTVAVGDYQMRYDGVGNVQFAGTVTVS